MGNYLQSFDQFGSPNLGDLFSLHEQGIMPKYNSFEFKKIFSGFLNESNSYMDDESLNEVHSYYELSMLAEARSSWGETQGEINYIDIESHVILIKNSEAFVLEKKTFEMTQLINEGDWSWPTWGDVTKTFNDLKNKVTSTAQQLYNQAGSAMAKTFDLLSDGAQKAWEWLKTAASAAGKLIGDNIETITLVLSILSAVFGIAGGVTTAVGVGPILTAVGGGIMALNGGLHIYEGFHKIDHAMEILKNVPIDPVSKAITGFAKAGPDFCLGGLFIPLGFYDISHGLTEALVNPAAGSIGAAVEGTAKAAGKTWIGSLGHEIEKLLGGEAGKYITKNPELAKAAGKAIVGFSSVLLSKFFSDVCGWLYEFMLKSLDAILTGINWLLDLPNKLTEAINKFSKVATGAIPMVIAKGLDTIVKPMTAFLARVCEKYFKPLVKRAQSFIQRQIVAKKVLDEALKKAHVEGGHKEEGVKASIPKTKGKPLVKLKTVKTDKKDLERLSKLSKLEKNNKGKDKKDKKGKVKESQIWEMKYIKGFDNLNFI